MHCGTTVLLATSPFYPCAQLWLMSSPQKPTALSDTSKANCLGMPHESGSTYFSWSKRSQTVGIPICGQKGQCFLTHTYSSLTSPTKQINFLRGSSTQPTPHFLQTALRITVTEQISPGQVNRLVLTSHINGVWQGCNPSSPVMTSLPRWPVTVMVRMHTWFSCHYATEELVQPQPTSKRAQKSLTSSNIRPVDRGIQHHIP